MRRIVRALAKGALALLLTGSAVGAQELSEICPGAADGTGAIWGQVTDPEGMVLPGANVNATWQEDGEARSASVQVQLDGSYTMCYLPLGPEVTVQAMFANMAGPLTPLTLTEVFTQHDVAVTMGGGDSAGASDDRIWLCVNGGESTINIEFSRLVRCDPQWQPLERCPKAQELGRVSAQPVGAGSGMMREMIEGIVQQAERLGANAVVNVRSSRSSVEGEAVVIEVDPINC
ncbi:MAG: hypothetical protein R3195_01615 [Gemmatimonadota bacterium]|nr:hypothetical protein [Gemmatimonadota bacterium]